MRASGGLGSSRFAVYLLCNGSKELTHMYAILISPVLLFGAQKSPRKGDNLTCVRARCQADAFSTWKDLSTYTRPGSSYVAATIDHK
jgi:hypothetical protein